MTPGQTVAVALSGGVDSAVTAALLKAEGHTVFGLTMRLGPTSAQAVRDARRVADHLAIAHHVLDLEDAFQSAVVQPFADAYASGETPLPCAVCNRTIKFGALLDHARALGASLLATGHYVRCLPGPRGPEVHRAVDLSRDQSYFLFALPRDVLGIVRFPLGTMPSKTETRARARALGIPVDEKPDSQDLCFAPGGGHTDIVRRLRPEADQSGPIVDLEGRVLGQHRGLIHHTVGQRRGLGVGGTEEPLYVVRLEAEGQRVVVGPRAALAVTTFPVDGLNWLGDDPTLPAEGLPVRVKIRNAAPRSAARVTPGPSPATAWGGRVTPRAGAAFGRRGEGLGNRAREAGGGPFWGRKVRETGLLGLAAGAMSSARRERASRAAGLTVTPGVLPRPTRAGSGRAEGPA
nr:tRNA 2-thiouridine(34) synthase MnmA [Pararhodospirillum photometricum]